MTSMLVNALWIAGGLYAVRKFRHYADASSNSDDPTDHPDDPVFVNAAKMDVAPDRNNGFAAGVLNTARVAPDDQAQVLNDSTVFADPAYWQRYKEFIIHNEGLAVHRALTDEGAQPGMFERGPQAIHYFGAGGEQNWPRLMMSRGVDASNIQIPAEHFRTWGSR